MYSLVWTDVMQNKYSNAGLKICEYLRFQMKIIR